jgi:hypothetical protein
MGTDLRSCGSWWVRHFQATNASLPQSGFRPIERLPSAAREVPMRSDLEHLGYQIEHHSPVTFLAVWRCRSARDVILLTRDVHWSTMHRLQLPASFSCNSSLEAGEMNSGKSDLACGRGWPIGQVDCPRPAVSRRGELLDTALQSVAVPVGLDRIYPVVVGGLGTQSFYAYAKNG